MARPKGPPRTKLVRLQIADALKLEEIAKASGSPIHTAFRNELGRSLDRKHAEIGRSQTKTRAS